MTVLAQNILELDEHSLAEVTRCYKNFISADLARLLRLTGFGALEVSAEGSWVVDQTGRRYLDFSGGYGVFSLGHRHPKVIAAVKDQLDRVALSSRVFMNPLQAKLAERLAAITPEGLQYSFFSNSGTEAIEAALKMARLATGRQKFVSTVGSYHGKTLGSLSVSGRAKYQDPFLPLIPGCSTIPFGDSNALEAALTDEVAAFLLEPIQGEGGIHVAGVDYLIQVRNLCTERGVLFIADEIQCGLCRTGSWFAVDKAGVAPDIMVLAKSLGGGVMPIGATVSNSTAAQAYRGRPLLHTSTFGGNPLACRAALASLQVMEEENLANRAGISGAILRSGLRELATAYPDLVRDVRGEGLMLGMEFHEDKFGGSLIFEMVKRNVIAVYTLNQPRVIRFEPPLNVETGEIETALKALGESLDETRRRLGKTK
jgi:putrescine aminotransferase